MACTKETLNPRGLNVWVDSSLNGTPAEIDIVLVQGLNADPWHTWTGRPVESTPDGLRKTQASGWKPANLLRRSQTEIELAERHNDEVFWPRDLLPKHLPPCTISTYSYSSDWRVKKGKTDLRTCGEQFLVYLHQRRHFAKSKGRPLIFIGHSMGGLVIQQALVVADHGDQYADIRESAAGAIFLGVPMQGCDSAGYAAWMQKAVGNDQSLLKTLKTGSEELNNLSRDFWSGYERLPMKCFCEDTESVYGGFKIKTVQAQSAAFIGKQRIQMSSNHSGLNKFTSEEDENFKLFLRALKEVVDIAIKKGNTHEMDKHDDRHSDLDKVPVGNINTVATRKWYLPFTRDPDFIDRVGVIEKIDSLLKSTDSSPRVALTGLGGIGKSQIAIEYAYRLRERSLTQSVFWVHASSPDRFAFSYQNIANELSLPGCNDPEANHLDLVYHWFNKEKSGLWILILDNADDAGFALHDSANSNSHEFSIAQYLPQRAGGAILITSRDRQAAAALVNKTDHIISVEPMSHSEAKGLVDKKIPDLFGNADDRSQLSAMLDFIPLAITQAAAYITNSQRMTIAKYLKLFAEQESTGRWLLSRKGGDVRRNPDLSNSLIKTWELSYLMMCSRNRLSADLLACMAIFDRQGIPEFLLRNGHNDLEFEDAIEMLLGYAFVTLEADKSSFNIHRLVQLATREWLESTGESSHQDMALQMIDRVYPTGSYENWERCQILEPHATSALQSKYDSTESELALAHVLYRRAWYHHRQGNYRLAEYFSKQSLDKRSKILGSEHSDTLSSARSLTSTYRRSGRYDEAEALQLQVVEAKKRVSGEDDPQTLSSIANLASIYYCQGRLADAEKLEEKVMESSKRLLGEEHSETLISKDNLASTYRRRGRFKESEELQTQVVESMKNVLGPQHPNTLGAMGRLAKLYTAQKRYGDAEKLQRQVVELMKVVLGEHHPKTLLSTGDLASMCRKQGRYTDAEELQVYVVELIRKLLGEQHPNTLDNLHGLALIYQAQGRTQDAKDIRSHISAMKGKISGSA